MVTDFAQWDKNDITVPHVLCAASSFLKRGDILTLSGPYPEFVLGSTLYGLFKILNASIRKMNLTFYDLLALPLTLYISNTLSNTGRSPKSSLFRSYQKRAHEKKID